MPPARLPAAVGIVGLGVMGGSLARALSAMGCRVRGYSPAVDERLAASRAGALEQVCGTVAETTREVDWWIVATPLSALPEVLAAGREHAPGAVMDLASLQRPALAAARAAGLARVYVSAHPMAGSERSGFGASDGALFHGATVWLSADPEVPETLRAEAEAFWFGVGAHPRWIEAATHDTRMAAISHLPQLVSNALALVLEARGFHPDELGPGGRELTRLAGSAPGLWRDVLAHSAADVTLLLQESAEVLLRLAAHLEAQDLDAVEAVMASTRAWRRS